MLQQAYEYKERLKQQLASHEKISDEDKKIIEETEAQLDFNSFFTQGGHM